MTNRKQQEGAVLLVAIVLLLVISVLGISAVKSSTNLTQVAGNSISSMLVYQGAESTLAKSASTNNWNNVWSTLQSATGTYAMLPADLPPETTHSGGILISTSDFTDMSDPTCPPGISSVDFTCSNIEIDAQTRLRSTNARDRHIKGVAFYIPK